MILAGCEDYTIFINQSEALSLDDVNTNSLASVFPNPSNGEFTISIELPVASELTADLYNISGQLLSTEVYDFSFSNALQIDMRDIAKAQGVYFLKLTTPEGTSSTQKVIIE